MVGVRVYHEAGRYYAAGAPVLLGRSDSGSKTGSYLDVGNGTVTIAVDNTNGYITVLVQSDGTGSYSGTKDVVCHYHAEWRAIAGYMDYVDLVAL